MKRLCCTAQFVAALALAGCGTVALFGEYDLPEGPAVASAPWPRLVDTPTAPPPGTYTEAVPDPVEGARAQTDLAASAALAEVRAERLSAPVISDAERAALMARARRSR